MPRVIIAMQGAHRSPLPRLMVTCLHLGRVVGLREGGAGTFQEPAMKGRDSIMVMASKYARGMCAPWTADQ